MKSMFTQTRNPLTGATEWGEQREDYDYHQSIARCGFADMLHDTERNIKYQRALKLAIDKMHAAGREANVLDIGTGTGILSIMAAKLGADSIVACESFKPVAECCIKILEDNGVSDKIKVVSKPSLELTVGANGDLPKRANILVTEVFDTELIGEGALMTFKHANAKLLERNSTVVPDSAVMYAQVVESPAMLRWNKLQDIVDSDGNVVVKTPDKMVNCPGSAIIHDIQLSQVPRSEFRFLSEPLEIFSFDWTGRGGLESYELAAKEFLALKEGKAQAVFVWWELKMDPAGEVILSCAPWWQHPDAAPDAASPKDSIPWRDHWMQAVYYIPAPLPVAKNDKMVLVSCHDEYSLWFHLRRDDEEREENPTLETVTQFLRPFCGCGVHMHYGRLHIAYLNDVHRRKMFVDLLKAEINEDSVVIDFNGGSLMGVAAATMGAKVNYFVQAKRAKHKVITDYARNNNVLENIAFVTGNQDELLLRVTHVISDPQFSKTIMPWENLLMAYLVFRLQHKFNPNVKIIPEVCEIWAMPVEFQHLQKIRVPLKTCQGIDMSAFDKLIETSRQISDAELECQPLWEYPTKCRGTPLRLIRVELNNIQGRYASEATLPILDNDAPEGYPVNGFVVWTTWNVGKGKASTGPIEPPQLGEMVKWDPYTQQAVRILNKTYNVTPSCKWHHKVDCDLERKQFCLDVNIVVEE